MFGGGRFEQRAINLNLDVARQQVRKDFFGTRLVQVIDLARFHTYIALMLDLGNRQQLVGRDSLLHDRLEFVVHDEDSDRPAGDEFLDGRPGDALRVGVAHPLEDADFLDAHLEAAAPEKVPSFPAHQPKSDATAGGARDEAAGRLDDVRVEAAAQSLVGRHHDQQNFRVSSRRRLGQ